MVRRPALKQPPSHNATQAAIGAGYSAKTARTQGNRLLTNVAIASAVAEGIEELQAEVARKTVIDKAWVLRELVDVYHAARSLDAPENANLPAANRALELMGKQLGMFVRRRLIARLDQMTEEQLIEFLGGEPTTDEIDQAARSLAGAHPAGHA